MTSFKMADDLLRNLAVQFVLQSIYEYNTQQTQTA